ncbi:MAG: cytochrome c3 family protein [Deltaproteobacteria bacterium]|jgi:c(7)-type cytochrome triheme protein|nr:cytochrome c3 family protein [Deltaproteobacteria bacterium]
MKKVLIFAVVAVFVLGLAGVSLASGPGKKVEYAGGGSGKVVFDGKIHAGKAPATVKCAACHPAPFKMKKEMKITMADMKAGKNCGVCHDGKKAFGTAECAKCHKK